MGRKSGATTIAQHQDWDHEIKLEPGSQPRKKPIYPMSTEKLNALRKYLDKNTIKGFIRKSQSPVKYPILFI